MNPTTTKNRLPLLLCCTLIVLINGCKPENTQTPPPPLPQKTITAHLNLATETTTQIPQSASNTPPTTVDTSNLVAIQIYSISKEVLTPYAYGIFRSLSIASVDLIENQQYSIEATVIIDGQNKIARRTADGAYRRPMTVGSIPQPITDNFIYTSQSLGYISRGETDTPANGNFYDTYNRPHIARYAGYIERITARESTPISIAARRVFCALSLRAEGLAKGSLEVAINGAPTILIPSQYNNRDTVIIMSLAGTTPPSSRWTNDNYSETAACTMNYINTDGSKTPITAPGGLMLTLKRNYIHPITVHIDKPLSPSITLETGAMIEDDQIVINWE